MTKEEKDKLLDEAVCFLGMTSPEMVHRTFVALLALCLAQALDNPRGDERRKDLKRIATIMAPFPQEVIELVASFMADKEVKICD
jgi:hypothetical protein